MKTMYCRLRKSTEHRSDSNIKHIRIVLAGNDCSDSPTQNWQFRDGLWELSADVVEIFLIVRKCFWCIFSNQKRKIDVEQMVSSLMLDFSIQSDFTTLLNSAGEESEDEIGLNLLESMLTLYLRGTNFKYFSLQKESFKLDTSRNKMKFIRSLLVNEQQNTALLKGTYTQKAYFGVT